MEESLLPPEAIADDRWVVRRRLRLATHGDHVRLNRHPMLVGLTRKGFPLEQYGAILSAYHRFYEAMEPALLECIAAERVPFSYLERQKLPWLAADLAVLGRPLPEAPAGGIPLPMDRADLIGVLYAIEGSTLGGQVIGRHLAHGLGFTAARGARFFNAYGADTAARWAGYCAFAEIIADDEAACRRAGAAAGRVFNAIENLLDDSHAGQI